MKRLSVYDKEEALLLIDCIKNKKDKLEEQSKLVSALDFSPQKMVVAKEMKEKIFCLRGIILRLEDMVERFGKDEQEQQWIR